MEYMDDVEKYRHDMSVNIPAMCHSWFMTKNMEQ